MTILLSSTLDQELYSTAFSNWVNSADKLATVNATNGSTSLLISVLLAIIVILVSLGIALLFIRNNLKAEPLKLLSKKEDSEHHLCSVRPSYNVFIKEYEINEEFTQEDMFWEGKVYEPSIRTKYYKIHIPFMVQGALKDVLYKAENYFIGLPNVKNSVEKLDCNGLDEAYYISSGLNGDNYFGLVIRKGNVILWIIYNGQKTSTEVMEASQALFD